MKFKNITLTVLSIAIFLQSALSANETFILLNNKTNEFVMEFGDVEERIPPGCTITIILSMMGFDTGLLKDKESPVWPFQVGYDDYFESWKRSQTPRSWIQTSCTWYSELVAENLGLKKFRDYLQLLDYGNQGQYYDVQDLRKAEEWLWDPFLKIFPKEQAQFIQRLIQERLPISSYSTEVTKFLHFKEELPDGWKLFGKTALDDLKEGMRGWFVGWIEKEENSFSFAYVIEDLKVDPALRIPRVKQLLKEVLKGNKINA